MHMRKSERTRVAKQEKHFDNEEENKLLVSYTVACETLSECERLPILMDIEEKLIHE